MACAHSNVQPIQNPLLWRASLCDSKCCRHLDGPVQGIEAPSLHSTRLAPPPRLAPPVSCLRLLGFDKASLLFYTLPWLVCQRGSILRLLGAAVSSCLFLLFYLQSKVTLGAPAPSAPFLRLLGGGGGALSALDAFQSGVDGAPSALAAPASVSAAASAAASKAALALGVLPARLPASSRRRLLLSNQPCVGFSSVQHRMREREN